MSFGVVVALVGDVYSGEPALALDREVEVELGQFHEWAFRVGGWPTVRRPTEPSLRLR